MFELLLELLLARSVRDVQSEDLLPDLDVHLERVQRCRRVVHRHPVHHEGQHHGRLA